MKRFGKCIVRNNCSNSVLFIPPEKENGWCVQCSFAFILNNLNHRKRKNRNRITVHDSAPTCTDVTQITWSWQVCIFSQASILSLSHTHTRTHTQVSIVSCRSHTSIKLLPTGNTKQSNPIPPLHVLQSQPLHEVRVLFWHEAYHKQRLHLLAAARELPGPPQSIKG